MNLTKDTPSTKGVLLFVDDEKSILNTLQRTFVPLNYTVFLAASAKAGLEILDKNHIDIIVSDIRMPHMDGATFLNIVSKKWPHVKRIILTGYASNYDIINDYYLSKPWKKDKIVELIQTMMEKNLP